MMKIEHVAMYVNDLEAAKEFFVKYLNGTANDGYPMRRKAPPFRAGDIRRVRRICASI